MRRRSLLRIDDSRSRRRRVALQQRTSISACAGSPSIDLIDIIPELNGSPTLCGSSVTMMQPADLRDCDDLALLRRFDLSWSRRVSLQCLMRSRVVIIVQVIPQGSAQVIFTDDDQNKLRNVIVGTVKKSTAAICFAWLARNVFQVCDGEVAAPDSILCHGRFRQIVSK